MDWSLNSAWQQKARERKKHYRRFLDSAKPAQVISRLPALHNEAFEKINCLDCANCCKNHSPTFKSTDLKRISKFLKIKETDLIARYLKLDEDNDFVLQKKPCTFLNIDNTCSIYEVRPSDCARYPYTDEDVFIKRRNLTMSNSTVCPAVHHILEKLLTA
jgi:Fe-S-cluster containining protein